MLIHLRVAGLLLSMNGRQGAAVADLTRPGLTLPIHYDDYPVFRSPLTDFAPALRDRGTDAQVRMWRRGDVVNLPYRQQPVRPVAPALARPTDGA